MISSATTGLMAEITQREPQQSQGKGQTADGEMAATPRDPKPPDSEPPVVRKKKKSESDSEEDDQNEVLEESPCGRWVKRREEVKQRDVPGIDVAYLAMDNETGNEVVWNEVKFSKRKNFKDQEGNIRAVFHNLTHLNHSNIVTFHKYWTDANSEKPRMIFITEFMSSGNMAQFLKRTKKGNHSMTAKMWKRWCTQILSALSYLHSADPPIIHGNLSTNTIFIQQNGLIKIGCVAPSAIHHHVKTFRDVNVKNAHYLAPEFEDLEADSPVTSAVDIYAFGICVLEMAVLGLGSNGESVAPVTQDVIQKTLDSISDPFQRDFITSCLAVDPAQRPTARQLLFHGVLFEVHSLKLLAAHKITHTKGLEWIMHENIKIKDEDKERVIAEIIHKDGRESVQFKYSQVSLFELHKLLEDVGNGVYPLTAFASQVSQWVAVEGRPKSNLEQPTMAPASAAPTAAPGMAEASAEQEWETETRRANVIHGQIKLNEPVPNEPVSWNITLLLRLQDKMNRELTADMYEGDDPRTMAQELVHFGFICPEDEEMIAQSIADVVSNRPQPPSKP